MADKHKYTVNRAMQDGAKSYERGDTREMTEIDAQPLLDSGALSLPGKEPVVRESGVKHTFGAEPSSVDGYTVAHPDKAITIPTKAAPAAKSKA